MINLLVLCIGLFILVADLLMLFFIIKKGWVWCVFPGEASAMDLYFKAYKESNPRWFWTFTIGYFIIVLMFAVIFLYSGLNW